MTALHVTLAYPPTTNHAYAVRNGRKVKTAAARNYALGVQGALLESRAAVRFRRELPNGCRFSVEYLVFPPDLRRRDLANVEKLASDAIFGWLGVDDSRIDFLSFERRERVKGGELRVLIETIQEAA